MPAPSACALAVGLKYRFGYDDSLDVVGVHLVGGIIGTLFIGLAASPGAPSKGEGLFYGGGFELLGKQALGAGSVLLYSFALSLVIGWIISKTMGFRVSSEAEEAGVDIALHAETAYSASSAGTGFHPLGAKAEAEVVAFNADDLLTAPSAKSTEKKVKA